MTPNKWKMQQKVAREVQDSNSVVAVRGAVLLRLLVLF